MDRACFCRWVVCRGVPGINNVKIGAVPALCENAPQDEVCFFVSCLFFCESLLF